jgi:hypothetical protein
MKIFKRTKEKKDAKIAAGIKSLTDKFKLKDKIAKANQWADKHKKKVSVITISMLMLSLIVGSWLTLTSTYNEADMMSGCHRGKAGLRRHPPHPASEVHAGGPDRGAHQQGPAAQARPRLPRPSARQEPPGLRGHHGEVPPVGTRGQVSRQQAINAKQ